MELRPNIIKSTFKFGMRLIYSGAIGFISALLVKRLDSGELVDITIGGLVTLVLFCLVVDRWSEDIIDT